MDKSIQEALKWIYASLGGDISDLAAVDDITAILNAIAALDTVKKISGGSDLPAVTSDDNGDVLTVVDGAWNKAAPSGSSDVFLFTIDENTGAANKTWNEFKAALGQGKIVLYSWEDENSAGQTGIIAAMRVTGAYGLFVEGQDISSDQPVAVASSSDDYPVFSE